MLIFVGSCYVMILATFVLYPLTGLSLLPQKWSEFLIVALGVLSGRSLQMLIARLPRQPGRFLVLAVLLIFIPSPLSWNRLTDTGLGSAALDRRLIAVAREIVGACQPPAEAHEFTVLSTPAVAYALPAVSNWRLFVAPNIHYATPLAMHKLHASEVQQLGAADTPASFGRAVQALGIDLLVFEKGQTDLLLEVDHEARTSSLLSGTARQSLVLRVAPQLLAAPFFTRVYEDEHFVAFLRGSENSSSAGPWHCRVLSGPSQHAQANPRELFRSQDRHGAQLVPQPDRATADVFS
jgi:hypothetical protein